MSSFFSARKSSPLQRVQNLQESFFRRMQTAEDGDACPPVLPASSGKLTGGETLTGSTQGNSFVFVEHKNLVCGGLIGTGGKFCLKPKGQCTVVKHEKEPFEELTDGLYIKGSGMDAYCFPCVPSSKVGPKVIHRLLGEEFEDTTGATRILNEMNATLDNYESEADLKELLKTNPIKSTATPVKRGPRNLDLRVKFDNILNIENVEEEGDVKELERSKLFNKYLEELTGTVEENRLDVNSLQDQVFESHSQIGIPPKVGPPSLWAGHMELKNEIDLLNTSLKRKADSALEVTTNELLMKLTELERNHKKLRTDTELSFQDAANEIYAVSTSNAGSPSIVSNKQTLDRFESLSKEVETLKKVIWNFDQPDKNNLSLQVGKFVFHSINDVGAWADQYLPPDYPFGPFVDAYSFLERVKSARDVGEVRNVVIEMDTRRKTNLSTDESTIIEAFQHPLPKCFRNSGSTANIGSWLPALKTKDAWENKSCTRGIKLAIRDNLEGIRFRIDAVITQRLQKHQEAADLARVLLSDTVTFITSLSAFISTTHLNLTTVGYPDDDAWNLVSKLVYRLFATDCFHDKRGVATEMLDSGDHRSMAVGILWATFATHHVMREYMRYSFFDHPSVGGEYTRFLVANAGISKINKAEKTINQLLQVINTLNKKLETLEKKTTTASSRADEALKMVKKGKKEP